MQHDYHYSPNLMVLGLFLGAGLMVYMATVTLITIDNITHLIILLSIAGTAFHYYKNGGGNKAFLHETIFFSIFIWGILGTGILLSLNYFTAQPLPAKVHHIAEVKYQNRQVHYIFVEGNPYKGFDYIIDYDNMNGRARQGEQLVFFFSSGILGLKVFNGVIAVSDLPLQNLQYE